MKAVGSLVVRQCCTAHRCRVATTAPCVASLRSSAFRGARLATSRSLTAHRRTFFGKSSADVQASLKAGDSMTDVSDYFRKLKSTSGNMVALSEFKDKQPVVLFFYPKAGTPTCTKEAQNFRDSYEEFKALGAAVFGISGDSLSEQEDFSKAQNLPYPLLVDSNNLLRKALGIKADLFGALPGRQTFVIDKTGKCVLSYNNMMSADAHVTEALNALKKL